MLDAPPPDGLDEDRAEIDDLHEKCGVYTKTELVERVLDLAGWTARADLASRRLLEPAAGDGQFLVSATERLLASCRRYKRPPTLKVLAPVITAFELHPLEAARARDNVHQVLVAGGVPRERASKLVARWVQQGDFLLAPPPATGFTHVVGNPPYVRWSSVPPALRKSYEVALPARTARGDLFLPFLEKGIDLLAANGKLGFVCSDRWKFMGFAERFRREVLPSVTIEHDEDVSGDRSYARKVDAYASVVVVKKKVPIAAPAVVTKARTLAEAGYVVRVGPALGCTPAYVLPAGEFNSVEAEVLAPWLDGTEIKDGSIEWTGRMIICAHDEVGRLRDFHNFPGALAHMRLYEDKLKARSIYRPDIPWYRPIDKVQRSIWQRPKLLVPELAKVPRIALDRSGAIPSHGVYAIFSPDDDLASLADRLMNGGLERALVNKAPKVKGGYVRCYKRFLDALEV